MMSYDAIIETDEMLIQTSKKFKPNQAAVALEITNYLSIQMYSAFRDDLKKNPLLRRT
jgi:hypothetical protein